MPSKNTSTTRTREDGEPKMYVLLKFGIKVGAKTTIGTGLSFHNILGGEWESYT